MTNKLSADKLNRMIAELPFVEQTQVSTQEQLSTLMVVANKFGLYDAADVLSKLLLSDEHRKTLVV